MSEVMTVRPFGGLYDEDDENWRQWSQSILKDKTNLVCTNMEVVKLTDLFDEDHRLVAKKQVVEKALDIYLNKPACNHIEYSL